MDSLTTTGDGEEKTMTSDSGEQRRRDLPWALLSVVTRKLALCLVPGNARPAGPKAAELGLKVARVGKEGGMT